MRFCKNRKSSEYPEYPEYVVEVFMKPLSKCSLRELSTIYNHLFTTDVCKRIEMMSIYILLLFGLRYRWNTQDLIDGKDVIMDGSYLGM